jgi:hypothetical protein
MKINEFKQSKNIAEGALLDLLLGPKAASYFAKDDDRHQEALKVFLKDFIGDATVSLSNGIQSGLIDAEKSSGVPSDDAAAGASAGLTAESRYQRLNAIFESIVEADGADSITEYMTTWFDMYMKGVDWRAKQNVVMPIIQEIEKTYATDQGRAAIEKLGRVAFSLSGPAKQPPAGARDAKTPSPEPKTPAAPKPSPKPATKSADEVARDLLALNATDRAAAIAKAQAAGR